jgi:hypothetical protein
LPDTLPGRDREKPSRRPGAAGDGAVGVGAEGVGVPRGRGAGLLRHLLRRGRGGGLLVRAAPGPGSEGLCGKEIRGPYVREPGAVPLGRGLNQIRQQGGAERARVGRPRHDQRLGGQAVEGASAQGPARDNCRELPAVILLVVRDGPSGGKVAAVSIQHSREPGREAELQHAVSDRRSHVTVQRALVAWPVARDDGDRPLSGDILDLLKSLLPDLVHRQTQLERVWPVLLRPGEPAGPREVG